MIERARVVLDDLLDGNRRFREGRSRNYRYPWHTLAELTAGQSPRAAVITCADSRVAPEVIFDQPLGSMLVARVPGNVASESARWMLDIAIEELAVPLVLVVGHSGCRAIQQVLEGKPDVQHDALQRGMRIAMERAARTHPNDLYRQTIIENALETVAELERDSHDLQVGLAAGTTDIAAAWFDIQTGRVNVLSP